MITQAISRSELESPTLLTLPFFHSYPRCLGPNLTAAFSSWPRSCLASQPTGLFSAAPTWDSILLPSLLLGTWPPLPLSTPNPESVKPPLPLLRTHMVSSWWRGSPYCAKDEATNTSPGVHPDLALPGNLLILPHFTSGAPTTFSSSPAGFSPVHLEVDQPVA